MRSMTGYGSSEGKVGHGRVFVEVKSVNHRYFDLSVKIPPKFNSVEPHLRDLLKKHIERGRVDFYMKEKRWVAAEKEIVINRELAKKYHACLKDLERTIGESTRKLHLLEVIDIKDLIVLEDSDVDYSVYWKEIQKIIETAVQKMDQMRSKEGAFLLRDQRSRIKKISEHAQKISKCADENYKRQHKKCMEKMQSLQLQQNGFMSAELDKIDISEELTRLRSHVAQYSKIIGQNASVGRQMDFILQEMNREINTIGSKSGDPKISTHVISIKSELEKLREQAQNIE